MTRFHRGLVISVVAALALYVGLSFFTGAKDVLGAVSHVDLQVWILVLGLSLLNYLLRFYRWHWYLAHLGHTLPPLRHLTYYMAGFAFTTTPGKMGEAIRSIYLAPHRVSYADSLAAFLRRALPRYGGGGAVGAVAGWPAFLRSPVAKHRCGDTHRGDLRSGVHTRTATGHHGTARSEPIAAHPAFRWAAPLAHAFLGITAGPEDAGRRRRARADRVGSGGDRLLSDPPRPRGRRDGIGR